MTQTFTKFCDEFLAQDTPFDAAAIRAVADNQRAIWDETPPAMAVRFNGKLNEGNDNATRWATTKPRCVFVRPYILRPGVKEIKIILFGEAKHYSGSTSTTAVTFWAGEGIKTSRLSKTELQQPVSSANSYTTLTIPVRQVVAPEITLLQVWLESTYDPSPTKYDEGVGNADGQFQRLVEQYIVSETEYETVIAWDTSVLAVPSDIANYPQLYALAWYPVGETEVEDAQTLVDYEGAVDGSHALMVVPHKPTAFDFPTESITSPTGFAKMEFGLCSTSYYIVRSLIVQEVRHDSAEELDTVGEEFYIPGNRTEAQSVAGALGANYRLFNEPRPRALGSAKQGGGIEFEIIQSTASVEAEAVIPIYTHHFNGKLAVYFLLTSKFKGGRNTDATIRMVWTAYAGVSEEGSGFVDVSLPTRGFEAVESLVGSRHDWGYAPSEIDSMLAQNNQTLGKVVIDVDDTSTSYGDGIPKPMTLEFTAAVQEGNIDRTYYQVLPLVISEPAE